MSNEHNIMVCCNCGYDHTGMIAGYVGPRVRILPGAVLLPRFCANCGSERIEQEKAKTKK